MARPWGLVVRSFLIVIACLSWLPPDSRAVPVHTFDCKKCHIPSLSVEQLGTGNVCLSCHDDTLSMTLNDNSTGSSATAFNLLDASNAFSNNPGALAGRGQTSHNWGAADTLPRAGAAAPDPALYPQFYSRFGSSYGKVTCTRCHNPHTSRTNPQLLVMGAGSAQQMCLACHTSWNQGHGKSNITHPVGIDYADSATTHPGKYASPPPEDDGNLHANNQISLFGGRILCGTCHQVHFADSSAGTADTPGNFAALSTSGGDGKLLRGDGPGRADKSGLCRTCHTYQAHGDAAGETVGCQVCHSGHSYDPLAPNYFMLRKSATTTTYNTVNGLDYSSANVLDPGLKYTFWNDRTNGTANGYCEKCHGDAHAIPDGGGGYHSNSANCTNCHGHSGAVTGSFTADCVSCHTKVQGGRAAVVSQFSGNSHHVQGTTISNQHCYQCHWEARSDGKINPAYHSGPASPGAPIDLVVYGAGSRPTAYSAGTTAIQYVADGSRDEIAEINSHCLGCHSDQNNTSTPFGDGKTPKQYAWDNTSVANRYSQSGTTTLGKYTTVANAAKKEQPKAYSAHGNAVGNAGGWSAGTTGTGVDGDLSSLSTRAGTVNVACYDCHNSHGSSVTGKATSYSSATTTGGILKDTQAGRGGYSATYKPVAGGSAAGKNQRNPGASLCMDCHMNDTGGGSQPWYYDTTFGASAKIIGYYDSPYFEPGTTGSEERYPYKTANNSKGGHFGVSSTLGTPAMGSIDGLCTPCHDPHGVSPSLGANQNYGIPLLKGTWLPSPYKEDVAPQNNWTGSYWNDRHIYIDGNTFGGDINQLVAGVGETDSQFAGLCLNCHPKNSLTTNAVTQGSPNAWKSKDRVHEAVKGWKTSTGQIKHGYPCSKCHTPHTGSSLPRLMVTNCMDPVHKGRVVNNPSPAISSGGDCGYGYVPGTNKNCGGYWDTPEYTLACHQTQNGNAIDQSWNIVTPGAPDFYINPLPSAQNPSMSATAGKTKVTIAWGTNLPSDSAVDFGLTSSYGQTVSDATLVTSHGIVLDGLDNHKTYHYRVLSSTSSGEQSVSEDKSYYLSIPPTLGTLISQPSVVCPDASCPVTLSWNAAQDVDGGPVEYYIEVADLAGSFTSPAANSGWVSTTSVTFGLDSGKSWSWRLKARDANHIEAVSTWLYSNVFMIAPYPTSGPAVPTLTDEPNFTCSGNCSVNLAWSTVSNPYPSAYGGVQYYLEVDDVSTFDGPNKKNSGWITVTNANINSLASEKTWYFRVSSRYVYFTGLPSAPSAYKSFNILYPLPSTPSGLASPDAVCPGGCSASLSWAPSTGYGGGAVQYSVEVDDDPAFASINDSSGWVSGTSLSTGTLATDTTWFWRVQARDASHVSALSTWASSSFQMLSVAPNTKNITFTWTNAPSNSINIGGTFYGGTGSVNKTVTTSFTAEIVGSPGQEGGGDPDPYWYYYAGRAPGGNPGAIAAIFTPAEGNGFTIKVGSVGEYRSAGGEGGGASYVAKDNSTVMYAAGAGGGGGGEATFDDGGEIGGYGGDSGEGFGSAIGGYGGAGSWDWLGDGYSGQPGGNGSSGSAGVTPTAITGDILTSRVTITLN